MATLGRRWAGRIFGTNTGNVFAELYDDGGTLKGVIRISDDRLGLAIFDVTGGSFDGARLTFDAAPPGGPTPILGTVKATADLQPDGTLRGSWASSLGTAGTLHLHPHDTPAPAVQGDALPEQIHSELVNLGAVRLRQADLVELVETVASGFNAGRPVVSYWEGGRERYEYADAFFASGKDRELRELRVMIQEPEAYGIARNVNVVLSAAGTNSVRVQGVSELWVAGKLETITRALSRRQDHVSTFYRRHGLLPNVLMFLAMLVALPEVKPWPFRAAFLIVVMAIIASAAWVHRKFIPNAQVFMGSAAPNLWKRIAGGTTAVFIDVAGTVLAALVLWILLKQPPSP